jgi:hypothetical protein
MKVHQQRDRLAAELAALKAELTDLIGYLISDKFNEDPTVQTADVIRRIRAAEAAALEAGESA